MRAFIGIPIDNETATKIYQYAEYYQKLCGRQFLKLSQVKNYHITLSFLGEINSLQLMHLEGQFKMLDQYNLTAFNLDLVSILPFPVTNPKVIAVMVKPNEILMNLQKNVLSIVNSAAIFQKRGKFIPHLTIARVKVSKNLAKPYHPLLEIQQNLDVNKIILYESQIFKTGAHYTPKLYYRW